MAISGRLLTSAAFLLFFSLSANTANAEEFTWFGQSATGNWLAGIKGSSVQNSRQGYKDAMNVGLLFGYQFSRPLGIGGTSAIEFEYSDSFDSGDVSDDSLFGVGGEWDVETMGVNFTYRTVGNVYFLAKLGGTRTDVRTEPNGSPRLKETDTSFSYGAGLGLKLGQTGNFSLELEFVGVNSDTDLSFISLGGIYLFQ